MTCNVGSRDLASAAATRPAFVARFRGCLLVWTGFALACSSVGEGANDLASTADEEVPVPPGWPLEVGDTIETGALHDLVSRFQPMEWADATDLVLNREKYQARIQASAYGIAAFDFVYLEVSRDFKGWTYACPPEGFVLEEQEGEDFWTLDGAIIVNLPPEIPCDPDKRFVGAQVYVGQVR